MTQRSFKAAPVAAAVALASLLAMWHPVAQAQAAAGGKPVIEKAADMPRFNYPVSGQLEDIVRSAERFAPLAAAIRRDTESVLAGYTIADKSAQRDLLGLLAQLDFLDGRYAQALERAEQVRALQDKPADKLLSGLRLRAMATAAQTHAPGSPAYVAAVAQYITQALAPLPFKVVSNDIKSSKASAELVGEALILGRVREVLQPMAQGTGQLSNEFAPSLVSARFALLHVLPLKAALTKTYGDYLAKNDVKKADIWAARDAVLPAKGPYATVNVAVWDSGVDTFLFKRQLLASGKQPVALIAFDKYSQPAQGSLVPVPAAIKQRLPELLANTKGFSDLQSDIDSAEAGQVKKMLSTLAPNDYKRVIEDLNWTGGYEHGTHVAGITLAGNPHARLAVARIEFGHTLKPDPCPSLEITRREARNNLATVEFFKRHKVRVVNMSWGGSVGAIEREMEQCGQGKTADERKAKAREMFDITKQSLVQAFASAPDIVFVAAAGNSNEDATFAEQMPADIVLPNLITVGAVDLAGDEASFTSYGPTVKVHANGYQVESYLPGGSRVALSGTSMAAPQVSNLAAKLLSANPKLKPADVIRIITETAERSEDGRRNLIHPKKALAAATAR